MAGNFDFLHIKRRTAGSSNELSFDVLDQKSAEAAGKSPRSSRLPKPLKPSQGNYHGVAGTSTLSGQAEVEKRKKARRASRIRLKILAAVVVVALVAVGVYAGVRYHESQVDYAGRIDRLIERLKAVDEDLVGIDAMMAEPFSDDNADKRKSALQKMPSLTTELNRISVDAQSMLELPIDDSSRVVVGQISKAALSRNDMMSVAGDVFRLSSEADEQVKRANRVWAGVLNYDQLAREAISAANKATTPEATTTALDMLREAMSGFEEGKREIGEISSSYGIDLSAQEAYLGKKIEALGHAVETSEALLAGNRDAATGANEAYNAADAEAVQLASGLPPSLGDAVQRRFSEMAGEYLDQYGTARDRTVETDSVIRDYLN